MSEQTNAAKIVVASNGPYLVYGNPTIVHKKQISSEHGEPMTWQTNERVATGNRPVVALCRCGGAANKAFCDGTHASNGFDGIALPYAAVAHRKTNRSVMARTGQFKAQV